MAEDPIAEAKQALRGAAEAARAAAHDAVGATAGAALAAHGVAALADLTPGIVSAYWPMRGEIDPLPLVEALVAAGWRAALPVTPKRGERLIFREWIPGAPLVAGRYGTSEPGPEAAILEPTVLLIPLLAFDRRLNRLGYGAGFYDRTLGDLRSKDLSGINPANTKPSCPDLDPGIHGAARLNSPKNTARPQHGYPGPARVRREFMKSGPDSSPTNPGRAVLAIGIAYAAQEVPLVPTNGWDERLDLVLTERGGLY